MNQLQKYVKELEQQFLRRHLRTKPSLVPPSRAEVLDAAAFAVLVHGALENFIEGCALWLLERIVDSWVISKKATRCTAAVLLRHSFTDSGAGSVYDVLRLTLGEAKKAHSQAIKANNGISSMHIDRLFGPLGVDVPTNPTLVGSIDALVSMRHHWAHQWRYGATVVKSARDAKVTADDCLLFAAELCREMRAARP